MVIMGIDSSTTSTGWAIIDTKFDNELRLVDYGVIKASHKDPIERMIYIDDKFKDLLREYKPELVVIEEVNVFRNAKSTRALIGLEIGLEKILKRRQALYAKLTPSQWRRLVGIKGTKREDLKRAGIEFVKNKYAETVNDDEGDAICIAEAGSYIKIEEE